MKKITPVVLISLALVLGACASFTPQVGMREKKWLRHTAAFDVVYIEGNLKAYRSAGAYYYFKDGALVKVTQSLLSADKL